MAKAEARAARLADVSLASLGARLLDGGHEDVALGHRSHPPRKALRLQCVLSSRIAQRILAHAGFVVVGLLFSPLPLRERGGGEGGCVALAPPVAPRRRPPHP